MKLFIAWLLKRVVPYRHLKGYMNRFYWFQTKYLSCRLHHILRSDKGRDLHDHPWWYLSIVLEGGYWEVTRYEWDEELINKDIARISTINRSENYDLISIQIVSEDDIFISDSKSHCWFRKRWYGPGSIILRRGTSLHRLELPEGETAKTLFFHGERVRDWGFDTINGWVSYKNYADRENH